MNDINLLWNGIFKIVAGPEILLISLFVVAAVEGLKITFKKLNSTFIPFIALGLSFLGVTLSHIHELKNVHDWVLMGLTQAFLIDIFYTYLGKPLLQGILFLWSFLLKNTFYSKKPR